MKFLKRYFGQLFEPAEAKTLKDESISSILEKGLSPWRSHLLCGLITFSFILLFGRLVYLQLGFNTDFLQKQGNIRFQRTVEMPAMRGRILDRNGYVLASSVPAQSIWMIPQDIKVTDAQLKELAKLLGIKQSELKTKAASKKSFVYLKRQVPMDVAKQIAALKIPGIHSSREYIRNYPDGEITAQITGLTGIDGNGVEGIELAEEKLLAGTSGLRRVMKDRLGRIIEDAWIRQPKDGEDIVLTIDARIQYLAYRALEKRVNEVGAKAGAIVVADPWTGDILALANYPSFDPNVRGKIDRSNIRNRAITDTYEPGSTMKPFSVAAGLEEKKVNPNTVFSIGSSYTIGRRSIGDSHYSKELSVSEIIRQSSNIGTAKVALLMTPSTMWGYYNNLGFGTAPQVGFPGAASGRMRPAKSWKPIEQATMSYGHGITVSLMQLVRAYTALARNGDLVDLSIYKNRRELEPKRIYSPRTAGQMKLMLESVVEKGAKRAQVSGYTAAGKTGTAYKVENGLYVKKYVSSFTGYAPAKEPRILVGVMIDEPKKGQHFGAVAAAPVFSEVVGSTLRLLSVNPDKPLDAPGLQTVNNGTTKPGATTKNLQAKNTGKEVTAKKDASKKTPKNPTLASNKTSVAQNNKGGGEKPAVRKEGQKQRRETAVREQSSKRDGGNG